MSVWDLNSHRGASPEVWTLVWHVIWTGLTPHAGRLISRTLQLSRQESSSTTSRTLLEKYDINKGYGAFFGETALLLPPAAAMNYTCFWNIFYPVWNKSGTCLLTCWYNKCAFRWFCNLLEEIKLNLNTAMCLSCHFTSLHHIYKLSVNRAKTWH